MEVTKLLNNLTFTEAKNLFKNQYGLVVKEDHSHPNLYLVTYDKNREEAGYKTGDGEAFLDETRGIILEKETNKVVSYTFSRSPELEYSPEMPKLEDYGLSWENCQIEESLEGTQIRLFHYQDAWHVGTIRCIDASHSKWNSKKNFKELFLDAAEAIGFDFQTLNPQYSYAIILQHPENQMVVSYAQKGLVHVLTRDLSRPDFPEIDVDIGLPKPNKLDSFQSFQELWEEMEKSNDLHYEGLMLKDLSNGKRLKVLSKIYRRAKDLRGNITRGNMIYQYLVLRKAGDVEEYLRYFPDDVPEFRVFQKNMRLLVSAVHSQYCQKFVNKKIQMRDVVFAFRPFIYRINGIHLETRQVMTRGIVARELYKMDPAQIVHIYRGYFSPSKPPVKDPSQNQTEDNQEGDTGEEAEE